MRFIVALFVCTVAGLSVPASAEYPGNPDAIGASRVLTMNPGEFTLLGTIQYKQTLRAGRDDCDVLFDGAVDGRILRPLHTHTGEKDTHRAQNKADTDNNEQFPK